MATEFLTPKNFTSGILAVDIDSDDLSIELDTGEAGNFPSVFPFHVVIDNEVLTVTEKVSGADEFVVTRGAESSTAVVHFIGAEVKLAITAGYVSEIQEAVNVLEGLVLDPDEMPNMVLGTGTAETKIEMYNASAQKALIKAASAILSLFAPNNTTLGLQVLDGGNIQVQGGKVSGALGGLLELFADTDCRVFLDADNNGTNQSFTIYNGAGNVALRVYESGTMSLCRNDAGTAGEALFHMCGASRDFYWKTLSSNLRLMDALNGEIVRFNYAGSRFLKDLKPLYNWDNVSEDQGSTNLGSATEIWKDAHIKNVVNYGAIISPPQTLAISATPSILNGRVFKVPALTAANIAVTSFADLVDGQEIILLGTTNATYTWTIAASNTFSLIDGAWTGSTAGASLHLIYDSSTSKWIEISRR